MRLNRSIILFALTGVIAASSMLGSRGKSSSPTNPGGGGSGGGSNTPFDSGTLTAPTSFDHVFPVAGTVGYHCNFHVSLGMVGTVTVSSSATATSATVTASGTSFSPSSVTIKPGGSVHWNIAGGTHTVTSD